MIITYFYSYNHKEIMMDYICTILHCGYLSYDLISDSARPSLHWCIPANEKVVSNFQVTTRPFPNMRLHFEVNNAFFGFYWIFKTFCQFWPCVWKPTSKTLDFQLFNFQATSHWIFNFSIFRLHLRVDILNMCTLYFLRIQKPHDGFLVCCGVNAIALK